MVNFTTGQSITLNHLVVFDNETKIFAAGREQYGNKHIIRLYLLNEKTGEVFTRNGRTETWNIVSEESHRQHIVEHVRDARRRNIPVYRINGQFDA